MRRRLKLVLRALLGDRPTSIVWFLIPTFLAWSMDLFVRPRSLLAYSWFDRMNYVGSTLAAAGFWGGPLWLISRLFLVQGRGRIAARIGIVAFFTLWIFPFAFFCYGGQALYHAVFHTYVARDTVRLGIRMRGTLFEWLATWEGPRTLALLLVVTTLVTIAFASCAKRAARPFKSALPIIPIAGFVAGIFCFWIDFVETRALQAAPPDTCFLHGVVHAARDAITGKGWVQQGITLRTPAPIPALPIAAHRPNVLVIFTESVRADAICSDPKSGCSSPYLESVIPGRFPLGRLTTQSSGTVSASVMLWTGLPPNADMLTMHSAPVLWELARAVGYRTAYVTSQNLRYEDFIAFTQNAGIDVRVTSDDIGTFHSQMGAPDEGAAGKLVDFVRSVPDGQPYFALLHYANTHAPYRTDPSVMPYLPESEDPLGDVAQLRNHYLNSVRFQEKTTADLLRTLAAMPRWDDTVVVFLSDHGEEFREHGGLYHLRTLFEEQVRIPGFLFAGEKAITETQAGALRSWARRRTYSQDVTATIVDLFGLYDARASLPYASWTAPGRSMLRAARPFEPTMPMSTGSGVWEPLDYVFGAMCGDRLVFASPESQWSCYDAKTDPMQVHPLPVGDCNMLVEAAKKAWPNPSPR